MDVGVGTEQRVRIEIIVVIIFGGSVDGVDDEESEMVL